MLNLNIPKKLNDIQRWGNLSGCGVSLALSELVREYPGIVVAMVQDFATASKLEQEIKFFLGEDAESAILHFPDWETLPYDNFSPHQDIISDRVKALYKLSNIEKGILIIPVSTCLYKLCPESFISQNTFLLDEGDTVNLDNIKRKLEHFGYQHTQQVMEHGDFVVRGSILDIFPMGSDVPYRIDLFDDEVDSIRCFDLDSQCSTKKVPQIHVLPAREFPVTDESISTFRTNWRKKFDGDPRNCVIYQDISEKHLSAGIEYYIPLFFEQTSTIFDYISENTLLVRVHDVESSAKDFSEQVDYRYEQYRYDVTRPILEPKELFLDIDDFFRKCKDFPQIHITDKKHDKKVGRMNFLFESLPDLTIDSKSENPLSLLKEFIKDCSYPIVFCVETAGRREILKEILQKHDIPVNDCHSWQELLNTSKLLSIMVSPIEQGILLKNHEVVLITESELFGRKVLQRRRRRIKDVDPNLAIRNLTELTIGSPIVHLDHGVGRYLGLTHLTFNGQDGEFVTLEYAGGDKLYVPVNTLNLISRYSGSNIENAPLHYLGTDKWKKQKKKAQQQIRDTAAELLKVYAKREAANGHQYLAPDQMYEAFASTFPFEETPDQKQAIEHVIGDLTSEQPMDRVICGDVGFGKTEVAMRAAFLVVQGGKQVAVLVPTTLLAQQHYQTFSDRFADFPVTVGVISRFSSKKEQNTSITDLKSGGLDIIIGTHKLLQSSIEFKELGLLVIDEEHRFGVRQKEKFKALRSEVDILTLTATPIPRTLNMSMSGMRDLSIISTPPAKRLSVKTFVREYNKSLIQEAIQRELRRGGQVYYLHNAVDTIQNAAEILEELLPEARISVAHGQMPERELERIMSDFYHRRSNVLVCTTIIETGIDIPTANTIIMARADKLGLAQLHQLRGRVGRSHHQAYAFCLAPPRKAMTPDARKRLDALEAMEALGSGFNLATHDLEIRGAGEILGDGQSGNMTTIGFTLFMELLENAVESLKSGKEPDMELTRQRSGEIDLQIPALIPEAFIPDVHTRLVLYKRIANTENKLELDELKVEMIDRFGLLPQQTKDLFEISSLKHLCNRVGIKNIKASINGGKVEFQPQPNIEPDKIIELISKHPNQYQFDGSSAIRFKHVLKEPSKRLEFIRVLLNYLLGEK